MITKKSYFWIFFLILMSVFLHSKILFFQKIYFIRDLTYIFHPWKSAVNESLINGSLPLWNPYAYCGMPLLANFQSAVFYPFSILFYVFGYIYGLKLYVTVHSFIAGFFMFLYLHKKGNGNAASFGGGIIFAIGGYLLTKTEFLSLTGSAVWLPIVLILYSHPIHFITALPLSFAIFAGYPPVVFFIALLALIAAIFEKKIKKLLIATLLTTIITAIQLMPSIELISHSVRNKGIPYIESSQWSLKLSELMAIISPVFLEKKVTSGFSGEKYFWIKSFWLGFSSFTLILCAVLIKPCLGKLNARKTLEYSIYALLVLISALLSMGSNTPVYDFFYKYIPGFRMFRYPAHLMFIPFFLLTLVTVKGISKLGKYRAVAAFIITTELFFYSWCIFPSINHDFYIEKGPIVYILQHDKTMPGFFLSPKTEWSEKIKVPDCGDIQWYILRDRLHGLTSMPHHLFNVAGFGEPLELKSHSDIIYRINSQPSADEAHPLLTAIGTKYLLTDYPIKSKNWKIVYVSHMRVYQNSETISRCKIMDTFGNTYPLSPMYISNEKIRIELDKGGTIALLDSFYPGWFCYINGYKSTISPYGTLFRSVRVPDRLQNTIIFIYMPVLFIAGSLLTVIFICIIFLYLPDKEKSFEQ